MNRARTYAERARGQLPPFLESILDESHYYYCFNYMRECKSVSMIAMWLIDYTPHVNSS